MEARGTEWGPEGGPLRGEAAPQAEGYCRMRTLCRKGPVDRLAEKSRPSRGKRAAWGLADNEIRKTLGIRTPPLSGPSLRRFHASSEVPADFPGFSCPQGPARCALAHKISHDLCPVLGEGVENIRVTGWHPDRREMDGLRTLTTRGAGTSGGRFLFRPAPCPRSLPHCRRAARCPGSSAAAPPEGPAAAGRGVASR